MLMAFVSRTTLALNISCISCSWFSFRNFKVFGKEKKGSFGKTIYIPLQSDIAQITWRPDFEQKALDAKIFGFAKNLIFKER